MAINYTKIGWDTSKYVNPTNMNQMDNGIKAACDAIDSEVLKLTNDALQTIANTATGANAAVSLKSNNVRSVADYRDQNGTALGMMGFDSNKKPTIYDVPANAWREIALKEDVTNKGGNKTTASFPFTPTQNGTIIVYLLQGSATAVTRAFTISEDAAAYFSTNQYFSASWGGCHYSVPVRAGHTYTITGDTEQTSIAAFIY